MSKEALVLQIIYMRFRESGGAWPDFDYIERWLRRYSKLDAVHIISRIPPSLLKPLSYLNGRPDPRAKLVLTAEGVRRCLGSDDDTHNLVAAVKLMVQYDTEYDPQPRNPRPQITAAQLADALKLPLASDSHSIERLMALLRAEGLVSDHDSE
jgi:hypothetical protein